MKAKPRTLKLLYVLAIAIWVAVVLAFLTLLNSCSTDNVQPDFKTGPVVNTPPGCVEGRKRGVDC